MKISHGKLPLNEYKIQMQLRVSHWCRNILNISGWHIKRMNTGVEQDGAMKPPAKLNPREQTGSYKNPIWAEPWWKWGKRASFLPDRDVSIRISRQHARQSVTIKLWFWLSPMYRGRSDPAVLYISQGSRCDVWSRTFLQVITVIEVLLPHCVPCLLNGGSGCVTICFAVGGLTELLPLDELGVITTKKTSQPESAAKPAAVSLCIFALAISISLRSHPHKGLQVSQDH